MKPGIGVLLPSGLQAQLFSGTTREMLNTLGDVRWNEGTEHLSEHEAIALLQNCEIAIGSWGTAGPSPKILEACPKLRLWEHAAGSVKRLLDPHMAGRELTIASCAPAIALNVAEMTVGLLIIGVRNVLKNAQENRTILKPDKLQYGKSLGDVTVGVLAASQVGRRVLEFLRPFHPHILLFDPYVSKEEAQQAGAEKVDTVNELCRRSDAVTLHTPALPETTYILGKDQFLVMKDETVIINTSRGKCLDEVALLEELQKGRFFAFLDVSDPEPAAMDSPLRSLSNVVYTAHISGGRTHKIGAQVLSDIQSFLTGESPLMVVTPEMFGRIA
ncbi:MAG: hydroxyacid dehydrogenase [bacterium]|nr:hydroxyacid dehydrogenase [bacterium]